MKCTDFKLKERRKISIRESRQMTIKINSKNLNLKNNNYKLRLIQKQKTQNQGKDKIMFYTPY